MTRRELAKALTLIESTRTEDQVAARELLTSALPKSGNAWRIAISGVPGVGKSTFIESFGLMLADAGHNIAVLAVDPSSPVSGGSILGDKTRMEKLSAHPNAFIRPTPTSGSLGGVARRTRESILLCEASGYDIILVETVGVGQSEFEVAALCDVFLLLMLPGAGDSLQGIKRGILELADLIVVNKADGENIHRAEAAKSELEQALMILGSGKNPIVLSCSALESLGLTDIWAEIDSHLTQSKSDGSLFERRQEQTKAWLKRTINDQILDSVWMDAQRSQQFDELTRDVLAGKSTPYEAIERFLKD